MNNLSNMTATAGESFLMNVKEEANCILAEIVRLAGFLTQDFIDPLSSKYKILVLDFGYFTRTAYYEKIIDENEDLQDSFYNTYGDLLSRFSTLFQTIANFIASLKEYCEQIGHERVGISYLDVVDIEILVHMGLVLLYLEKYLPGLVRERIYVAIYRNSDERRNVDFLVDFLRVQSSTSDPFYLFERLNINESVVQKCLSCCETIHREPSALKSDFIKMRQIVEYYFRDEWVLQLGLGSNVNLLDAWQSYRAASSAISSVDVAKAKDMASYHYNALSKLNIPQEFVNSETASRIVSYSSEGLTGSTGRNLEIRLIAHQLQADITTGKVEKMRREMEIRSTGEPPENTAISLINCKKDWVLAGPPPFIEVNLNDLVVGHLEGGKESKTLFQRFAALYRHILQKVTDPPYRIQQYAIRENEKGGRNKNLQNLPRVVENMLMDFAEDLLGCERATYGQACQQRMLYRPHIFRALQVALRDIRNYRFDHENQCFIPNNRKASGGVINRRTTTDDVPFDEHMPQEEH